MIGLTLGVYRVDQDLMRRCIALALGARARGDTPVGSLVVRAGQVVAEAGELLPSSLNITGHAEVLAIQQACTALGTRLLSGCTLYTTAEPCWMCSYVIRECQIAQVVLGVPTPEVGGYSTPFNILTTRAVPSWGDPPDVISGILAGECAALMQGV